MFLYIFITKFPQDNNLLRDHTSQPVISGFFFNKYAVDTIGGANYWRHTSVVYPRFCSLPNKILKIVCLTLEAVHLTTKLPKPICMRRKILILLLPDGGAIKDFVFKRRVEYSFEKLECCSPRCFTRKYFAQNKLPDEVLP